MSVRAVRIRLGTLSAIVPAALQSGFAIATRDTPLEGARLDIQPVAPMIWCAHCGGERGVLDPPRLRCADCGNRADRLTRGRELELVRIELNDPAPEVALAAENRRGPSTDP